MKKWLLTSLIIAILLIGSGFAAHKLLKHPSPFSTQIRNQSQFLIFYPDPRATGYKVDVSTIQYDTSAKVLSFTAQGSGNSLTITEQTTPDPFNDIPQYWDAFTTKLQNYASFDSVNGQIALTQPVELKGGQSAVMNSKGTLMFVHPTGSGLSEDQWKQVFNNLESTQPL